MVVNNVLCEQDKKQKLHRHKKQVQHLGADFITRAVQQRLLQTCKSKLHLRVVV